MKDTGTRGQHKGLGNQPVVPGGGGAQGSGLENPVCCHMLGVEMAGERSMMGGGGKGGRGDICNTIINKEFFKKD